MRPAHNEQQYCTQNGVPCYMLSSYILLLLIASLWLLSLLLPHVPLNFIITILFVEPILVSSYVHYNMTARMSLLHVRTCCNILKYFTFYWNIIFHIINEYYIMARRKEWQWTPLSAFLADSFNFVFCSLRMRIFWRIMPVFLPSSNVLKFGNRANTWCCHHMRPLYKIYSFY